MEKKNELTQKEKMSYVKFARNNVVAADDVATILLDFTEQLESIGILAKNRPSKQKRDKKIESIIEKRQQSDVDIQQMMDLIPSHPDSEKIINSLFKNLSVPKYVKSKANKNPIIVPSLPSQETNAQKPNSQLNQNSIPNQIDTTEKS